MEALEVSLLAILIASFVFFIHEFLKWKKARKPSYLFLPEFEKRERLKSLQNRFSGILKEIKFQKKVMKKILKEVGG